VKDSVWTYYEPSNLASGLYTLLRNEYDPCPFLTGNSITQTINIGTRPTPPQNNAMVLSNDERGWVMTILSGVACIVGASVICVDIIIRQFPGKRDFRIQDSDTFLSMSLSLSFGVMLFSALYSMLPSAKRSLQEGGYSPKEAAWILIACFMGGVIGIQIISRVLHQFVPSHVVDCEHNHEEEGPQHDVEAHNHQDHHHDVINRPRRSRTNSLPGHTPLGPKTKTSKSNPHSHFGANPAGARFHAEHDSHDKNNPEDPSESPQRPSLQQRLSKSISKLTLRSKANCDTDGPCHGFSDVCGAECFKNINANGGARGALKTAVSSRPSVNKSATATTLHPLTETTPLLQNPDITTNNNDPTSDEYDSDFPSASASHITSSQTLAPDDHNPDHALHKSHSHSSHTPQDQQQQQQQQQHHHHHVPQNAFLSIGLQTSIAIALHKLPEGFITYATNHANPKLGVAVFLALFIHNITEGFALALPLYLALNSRSKAMATSFVLGGLSQPIGAGVAALWFHVAGEGEWAPSEGVYGGMFAVTAGIMASVALQLFGEALDLTHSRGLCMVGAFLGMGVLGVSSALTA
jgi:ZIP family zinc transporter